MSYSNYFKLTLHLKNKMVMVPYCDTCDKVSQGKFCSDCGTELIEKEIEDELKGEKIINQLRKESEDCGYLLGKNGDSYESGSGQNIESDIRNFSKKYPNILFQLDIDWESGLDESPSRDFYLNGKCHSAEFTFEEFDENKLR